MALYKIKYITMNFELRGGKGLRCYPFGSKVVTPSHVIHISSLLSLFLAQVNVDKAQVFESCEIAHVRGRLKGWNLLTLISHFS